MLRRTNTSGTDLGAETAKPHHATLMVHLEYILERLPNFTRQIKRLAVLDQPGTYVLSGRSVGQVHICGMTDTLRKET